MASITAQRNELTQAKVRELEDIFYKAGIEFYRTGANFNTLTYECGEIEGKPIYGSIKFTLHKTDYSLDDEIEEFEMLLEERKKKRAEKERKEEKARKERERKERAAAEKKAIAEKEKEKRKEYLAAIREKETKEVEEETERNFEEKEEKRAG